MRLPSIDLTGVPETMSWRSSTAMAVVFLAAAAVAFAGLGPVTWARVLAVLCAAAGIGRAVVDHGVAAGLVVSLGAATAAASVGVLVLAPHPRRCTTVGVVGLVLAVATMVLPGGTP